jgi:hypothetical protein
MKINYFKCKYHSCGSSYDYDIGECSYIYYCMNPKGNNYCDLNNKDEGQEDDCELLN